MIALLVTRHVDSILSITFDHDLQMTRNWYGSKALVEAHLFRGVSSQSEHFLKIAFLTEYAQTEAPLPPTPARPAREKRKSNQIIENQKNLIKGLRLEIG